LLSHIKIDEAMDINLYTKKIEHLRKIL
jgi:hypothetical protein